jgi:mannosyltransferase
MYRRSLDYRLAMSSGAGTAVVAEESVISEPREADPRSRRSERWTPSPRLLFGLELLLAAVLGLLTLGKRSFFLDETASVTIAKQPWHQFWHVIATREGNMVLYHLLLSEWMKIDNSEFFIRLISVAAFVGSVAALYALARRVAGERVALVAGLLLAINPFMIHFAQTARGYELSVLLVTCSALLFARALERQTWAAWLSYSLLGALGVYAHFFALLVPAGLALSLLFVAPERLQWRKLIGAAAAMGVLLIPFFYLLTHNTSSGIAWSAGNPVGRLFVKLHAHKPLAALFLVVCAAAVVSVFLLVRRVRGPQFRSQETWSWALPICWLLTPFAIVAVVALAVRPMFVTYYFMVCVPAAVLVVSMALVRLRISRGVIAIAAAVVILASLALDVRWYRGGSIEDWRGATAYVLANDRPGDGVLFVAPYVRIPFAVYLDREPSATRAHAPAPVYPSAPFTTDEIRYDYYIKLTTAQVLGGARRFKRIWFVESHVVIEGRSDPRYVSAMNALAEAGFTAGPKRSFAGVVVVRYDSK